MNKFLIIAVAIVVAIAGFFWLGGRSAEDVEQVASDAATTAVDAASDAADAAGDAVSAAAGSVSEELSGLLEGADLSALGDTLKGLKLDGFDVSTLDPSNFDLTKLMEGLGAAGLSQEAMGSLNGVFEKVKDSPELLAELLTQIKSLLGL